MSVKSPKLCKEYSYTLTMFMKLRQLCNLCYVTGGDLEDKKPQEKKNSSH